MIFETLVNFRSNLKCENKDPTPSVKDSSNQ